MIQALWPLIEGIIAAGGEAAVGAATAAGGAGALATLGGALRGAYGAAGPAAKSLYSTAGNWIKEALMTIGSRAGLAEAFGKVMSAAEKEALAGEVSGAVGVSGGHLMNASQKLKTLLAADQNGQLAAAVESMTTGPAPGAQRVAEAVSNTVANAAASSSVADYGGFNEAYEMGRAGKLRQAWHAYLMGDPSIPLKPDKGGKALLKKIGSSHFIRNALIYGGTGLGLGAMVGRDAREEDINQSMQIPPELMQQIQAGALQPAGGADDASKNLRNALLMARLQQMTLKNDQLQGSMSQPQANETPTYTL